MSRKRIAILFLQAVLICSACGERDANDANKDASRRRESEFQKKRVCEELGRRRLAWDSRKEEEWITDSVRAEWCYSVALNTCIYSDTHDVIVSPKNPNATARIVLSSQTTVDLLTNRTLIFVDRAKASQVELKDYERKRRELFGKCQ